MGYWVYIIQSQSSERYYCGQTDNLEKRLQQHNDPHHTFTKTTKRFKGPWLLVCQIACGSRTEAMRLEKQIKKRGIQRYLAESKPTGGC
jgi:putative endonuclease